MDYGKLKNWKENIMTSAAAIIRFFNSPGYNPEMRYSRVTVHEIKKFKAVCTQEEWTEFGRQACEAIGEEFGDYYEL